MRTHGLGQLALGQLGVSTPQSAGHSRSPATVFSSYLCEKLNDGDLFYMLIRGKSSTYYCFSGIISPLGESCSLAMQGRFENCSVLKTFTHSRGASESGAKSAKEIITGYFPPARNRPSK